MRILCCLLVQVCGGRDEDAAGLHRDSGGEDDVGPLQ